MLSVEGRHGEGGGQIVRTALALAVLLRRPVTLTNVRARRPKPGLQAQHLAAVRLLAALSEADVEGAVLHATTLRFHPRALRCGTYEVDVGTAGAVSLVFQAALLPLAFADGPSRLVLHGGTHVPWSPPVHYLRDVLLPTLARMGVHATVQLDRWGWYPRGGGSMTATITPCASRRPRGIDLRSRHAAPAFRGLSAVAHLPRSIADRQAARVRERLACSGLPVDLTVKDAEPSSGPGTFVFLVAGDTAGFSGLGAPGRPAERVADMATDPALAWLRSGAAVDAHLADQLLPFCALAQERSSITCPDRSAHLDTVAWLLEQFLPARIRLEPGPPIHVHVDPR